MPGLIYTPQLNKWFIETAKRQGSDDPEFGKQYALKNIIHQTVSRLGQPMDIAAAVCFLASPLASRLHDRHNFPHRWWLDTYRVER
jgi:NAD(P)-dependent dehydrogenase (short-subunit alcohol dehydrogenase family)